MNILNKVTTLLFLHAVFLTSCNGIDAPSAIHPTDVSDTAIAIFKTELVETLTAAPTNTPTFSPPTPSPIPLKQTPYFPPPFDRHDPEFVLRAYFDAWDRQDWVAQESLRPANSIPLAGEPVDFVRLLELTNLSSSPAEYVYKVRYEVGVNGQGSSTQSRVYVMKYYLIWDPNRDTWCVSGWGYP